MPTRPIPPYCSHGCQQTYIEFLALPPLLFALQSEQLFLVSANSDKTPHHTHLQHAEISQKSQGDWPPFLLTASYEALPPIPYCPFSAEAEKNLSVCYIRLEVEVWSNVTTTSKFK